MGNMSGSYGSHYTLWASITENSYSVANNTSNVTIKLYLTFDGSSYYAYTDNKTYGEMKVNRWADDAYATLGTSSIVSISFSSGVKKDLLLAQWTDNIDHNPNGKKTVKVQCTWDTNTERIGSGSCTAELKLTDISRYVTISSFSVSNINGADGLTKVKFSWSADANCDYAWYSIDGGTNWYALATTNIVSGLSSNTSYNFRLRLRRTDSQLTTDSSIVTKSTYDIARISSLANFEHGSNPSVGITNPASISSLSLIMKIGDTQVLSRTVTAGNNAINFSDTELDNLYKNYGSSNSLTATFVLSGSGYTNTKTCTVTLQGNQKTIHTNVNSSWRPSKLWTNVNGTWRRAVLWTNVNGTWRRGI